MRLPAGFLCCLLFPLGALHAANKPNPVCLSREEFVEHGRRTSSPAVFKMLFDPGQPTSFTRQFASIFDGTEAAEKAALAGDLEARYALGDTWAECMLDGFEYSPEKRARTIEYLRAASDAGRKQSKRSLGFFEALGWAGSKGSALTAFPLLLEGGAVRAPKADEPATPMPDGEKAVRVFAATLQRVLSGMIGSDSKPYVVDSPGQHAYPLSVQFSGCRSNVVIEGASARVRVDAVSAKLDAVSAMLPRDGMDCSVPERTAFKIPITLQDTTP